MSSSRRSTSDQAAITCADPPLSLKLSCRDQDLLGGGATGASPARQVQQLLELELAKPEVFTVPPPPRVALLHNSHSEPVLANSNSNLNGNTLGVGTASTPSSASPTSPLPLSAHHTVPFAAPLSARAWDKLRKFRLPQPRDKDGKELPILPNTNVSLPLLPLALSHQTSAGKEVKAVNLLQQVQKNSGHSSSGGRLVTVTNSSGQVVGVKADPTTAPNAAPTAAATPATTPGRPKAPGSTSAPASPAVVEVKVPLTREEEQTKVLARCSTAVVVHCWLFAEPDVAHLRLRGVPADWRRAEALARARERPGGAQDHPRRDFAATAIGLLLTGASVLNDSC